MSKTNCKPGDTAAIAVLDGHPRTLDGKRVTVISHKGKCDLDTFGGTGVWLCEFAEPWHHARRGHMVERCFVSDSWLRPVNKKGD